MSHASRTVLITGGNNGLGLETARRLAMLSSDWHLVIAARSRAKGESAVGELIHMSGNPHITFMELDLGSMSSIQRFAAEFRNREFPPLHALICNAGVQHVRETQTTEEGWEATFGVNHLGHFLLTRLLLPHLSEAGRIVVVSSDTHDPAKKTGMPAPRYAAPGVLADPEASDRLLQGLSELERGQIRYTTSKLINLYFAYEWSRKLKEAGRQVAVVAFNPGMMPGKGSSLARNYHPLLRFVWNYILPLMRPFRSGIRSTTQSGSDLAGLIVQPSLESGTYWDGRKQILSSEESLRQDRAEEVWNWSSATLGLNVRL